MIILLHPLGADPGFWDPVRRSLPAVEVRAPSLATPPDGAAVNGLTVMADEVASSITGESALVVGISLGGLVAIELATRHPSLVRGLVIADAVPAYPPAMVGMWRERAVAARGRGLDELVDPTMSLWFTADTLARGTQSVVRARRMLGAEDPERYARHCEVLASADAREEVRRLRLPVHVVCGEDDAAPFVEAAHWMAAAVPGAALTMLSDARHATALERPEAFAEVVAGLWDSLNRGV